MARYGMRRWIHGRGFLLFGCPVLTALLIAGFSSVARAGPEGGVVRTGSAQIVEQGSTTLIRQSSPRAIIDWRNFGILADERVQFAQPSSSSATLNRVTGDRVSVLLGRMDANGQVLLINPNGIILGQGAQINVGSLIASTANISNNNFMEGRLVFDEPGRPGAGVINSGRITAAEGGLVALVAPHVRNDGLIQARLGKVVLGAADTFTIDLYGDGLVHFALSEASLAELKDGQGQPVKSLISQTGTIDVGTGKAVLVTAETAKGVLDSLINMSGTILADSAVKEGGRILLLGRGGNVDVSGHLSARGTTGGQIDVLGDQVHLSSTAKLDVDGAYGGGGIHVGGAYQGSGDTYRAQTTQIDAGATLQANARIRGNGGEVVAWSDGETSYAGSIEARGGVEAGDGGWVEVSGKQSLLFNGLVDAGASQGRSGSLLLDPYDFTIGRAEASLINRVLRTGTSTSVTADHDMFVNYTIDGRGRYAGGGLTLTAGHNLNVNDNVLTNNGAINLFATTGSLNLASGKVVYSGTSPITLRSGGTLTNAAYLIGGPLSLISTQGSVNINQGIGNSSTGNLLIQASGDVDVNQPIVSLSDGDSVTVTAGNDINVNAQIDGRSAPGSNPNGTLTMTAGRDIDLNKSILAGGINLTASLGTVNAPTMTAGTVTLDANGIPHGEGLFAGTGPISVTAGGNLLSGVYVTTGPVSIRSTGGNINVDTKLAEILGNVIIQADAGSVNIGQEIANIRSGSNLAVTAGTDINLNRQIDALDDSNPLSITPVPGGSVSFAAGRDVLVNDHLATNNGAIAVTGGHTIIQKADGLDTYGAPLTKQVRAGNAAISVTSGGDMSLGSLVTTGALNVASTSGNVSIDVPIYETTGNTTITAAKDININQVAANTTSGSDLTMTSTGGQINVDAKVGPWDRATGETLNRNALPGGNITLSAYGNINVNTDIASYKGALTDENAAVIRLNAGTSQAAGTVNLQDGIKVMSDSGAIHATAFGDLTNGPYINDQGISVVNGTPATGYFTMGALNLTSTAGSLTINQTIPDTTGEVTLQAGNAITVNQRIYSNNADISLFAGPGGIFMTPDPDPSPPGTGVLSDIDARGGNLTLVAEGDIYPSLLRTYGTLTVKSTNGVISGGRVTSSRREGGGDSYPGLIELAGSLGIIDFNTENSRNIKAISDRGSVKDLSVNNPSLEVIARDDIEMAGWLGNAGLYAGRDIKNISGILAGDFTEKAGGSITVGSMPLPTPLGSVDFSYVVDSLNLAAGTNPFTTFSDDYQIAGVSVKPLKDAWTPAGLGNISVSKCAWIEGEGGLTGTATGSITMDNIHVSYSLMPVENTTDPRQAQQPFSLTAGGNINLPERIENMGPVALISNSGNINIGQTIGAHVTVETPDAHLWNPYDKGVADLAITASNGNITMQEARAEGDITIQAYGNGSTTGFITTPFGPGIQVGAGKTSLLQEYTYDPLGVPQLSKTYVPGVDYATTISPTTVDRLPYPEPIVPAISPGPMISGPAAPPSPGALPPGLPVALTALPTQAPDAIDVSGSEIPAQSAEAPLQEIDPRRAIGTAGLSEMIPEESEDADEEGKKILKFSGGRGLAQEADLGRR